MTEHMNNLLKIPGSKVLFGGEPLENHSIPKIYGALKPTAVFVPLEEILKSGNFELVTKEIFGPFQVIDPICNYLIIMGNNMAVLYGSPGIPDTSNTKLFHKCTS